MVKDGGKIIAPVSVQCWALTSDMDGLLDFPFDIYRLFIKNFDSFPVNLVKQFSNSVGVKLLVIAMTFCK